MRRNKYRPVDADQGLDRREFVKAVGACSVAAGGVVLGVPAFGRQAQPSPPVATNVADFTKVPRTKWSLPGPFPGKVVKVTDPKSIVDDKFDAKVVSAMFEKGIRTLTGKSMKESAALFFEPSDVIGLKVNPVGFPLINTRHELVDAVIAWMVDAGIPKRNIVIWDRFDYMLTDAGFTADRFPGIAIEGLQTMDEKGNKWRDADGNHVSAQNFDKDVFLLAKGVVGKNVRGYKDDEFYLNQHVFNGEYSYFGKLLTKRLTKIVNLAAHKNTGAGISMATKNIGYGAICNTGRLHAALFFRTNTEVHAAPVIRDKLVLNVTDGLRGQYDGGPDKNAQFVYPNASLYFATDPFALDMFCHNELMEKRREMGVAVNDNPRFTEYLHYGEELGLGIANPDRITVVRV
ncbi:MAG: DUF362 domain-containing protein [Vicinamibacterales bacterium]